MPTITVKDIPEDLHAKLKEAAAAEGRSLNKEIILRLKISTMQERRPNVKELLARAEHIRSQFRGSLSPKDIDRWKRQGRA